VLDALVLAVREYRPTAPRPGTATWLFLHGLTRNSLDSHDIACTLAGNHGRRVFAWDTRGRGLSSYGVGPFNNAQYARDLVVVLDKLLKQQEVCICGTSMGGLITCHLLAECAPLPCTIKGCVFVDIGPKLELAGLQRILGYINTPFTAEPPQTFEEAAVRIRTTQGFVFPTKHDDTDFWLEWAHRAYRKDVDAKLVPNYDSAVVSSLAQAPKYDYPDLFGRAMRVLPHLLVLRGALSDLLSADGVELMKTLAAPKAVIEAVIADVGHAPLLNEPDSEKALLDYAALVDGQ